MSIVCKIALDQLKWGQYPDDVYLKYNPGVQFLSETDTSWEVCIDLHALTASENVSHIVKNIQLVRIETQARPEINLIENYPEIYPVATFDLDFTACRTSEIAFAKVLNFALATKPKTV